MAVYDVTYLHEALLKKNDLAHNDLIKKAIKNAIDKKQYKCVKLEDLDDWDKDDDEDKKLNEASKLDKRTKDFLADKIKNSKAIKLKDLEKIDDWDKDDDEDKKLNEASKLDKRTKDFLADKRTKDFLADKIKNSKAIKLKDLEKIDDPDVQITVKEDDDDEDEKLKEKNPDAWAIKHGTYAVTTNPRYHF